MDAFLDIVQNVILDVKHAKTVHDEMAGCIGDEPEDPTIDIYGNIIGNSDSIFPPNKNIFNYG